MSRGPSSLRPDFPRLRTCFVTFLPLGRVVPTSEVWSQCPPCPPSLSIRIQLTTLTTINILPHSRKTLKITRITRNNQNMWPSCDTKIQVNRKSRTKLTELSKWYREEKVKWQFLSVLVERLLRSRSIKILKCKQTFLLQNQIWQILI